MFKYFILFDSQFKIKMFKDPHETNDRQNE